MWRHWYELIKAYRGAFTAGFYQMFAKMFGASLKTEYGSHKDDATIERIINLVESGQLWDLKGIFEGK